ncbi:ShlB/FhaC/HecB family hemolysin secretion/activation protein [Aulosira sp. FACHB-615]|uniref:ShlB/FhaC/HecB family hemolysin secretion/activation protein n=1 Tax=Aulosira sp. FACHB-615 TaxID=2692777 RepID=UPI0016862CE2|nr:ShlB/FhaC/HecB family hemolysin secretion/activation protein [Aulosira sp. FACHB-615]MBD2492324.1 ShlB/FhaC/HecB family hemolysin secretion/activation protein [Aulosira sp. FACHB-615]
MQHYQNYSYNFICWLLCLSPFVLTASINAASASNSHFDSLSIIKPSTETPVFPPLALSESSVSSSLVTDFDVEFRDNSSKQLEVFSSKKFEINAVGYKFWNSPIIYVAQVTSPTFPVPPTIRNEPQPDTLPSNIPNPILSPEQQQSPCSPAQIPEAICETDKPYKVTSLKFVNSTVYKSELLLKKLYKKLKDEDNTKLAEKLKKLKIVYKKKDKRCSSDNDEQNPENYVCKFSDNEDKLIQNSQTNSNHEIFLLSELIQISSTIAKIYADDGFDTSGAVIYIPKETQLNREGIVIIRIIEGELNDIKVTFIDPNKKNTTEPASSRLNREYVRSRIALAASKPLNTEKLREALQLLQINPLIKSISARLSSGTNPGESILDVQIQEANSFNTALSIDNGRAPSVGSFERRAVFREANLLGLGDRLSLGYTNTDGSNNFDASYTFPLNPSEGTLSFAYINSQNQVIEPPFDDIDNDGNGGDIESESRSYELTLRQPISRRILSATKKDSTPLPTFEEVALGLTASLRESQTSLLNIPFPLSPGADDNGVTRIFALRFFQDWTRQNAQEVIAFRSQFSFGFHAFNSTINQQIPGINEVIPDSRFFSWQGQALWLRVFGNEKYKQLFRLRANAQLADRALASSEQLVFGGLGSVRGYRQDILQTDNGVFLTGEYEIPILQTFKNTGVVQVVPFVDYGIGWNSSGNANPSPNSLASLGLGLQWQQGNDFTARFDWGIPLISAESRGRTWQENGLYFSVQWNRF